MGQTLELSGGLAISGEGQREGFSQVHQIPPTCFSTRLKVSFSPCCCGGEELLCLSAL